MTVYSAVLWSTELPPGSPLSGPLIPATEVWVIRDIIAFNFGSADDAINLLSNLTNIQLVVRGNAGSDPIDPSGHWQGRAVLPPGDQLILAASANDWYVHISGYRLLN